MRKKPGLAIAFIRKKIFVTGTEMSEDNRSMLVSKYVKRNYVKKHKLRFTYLRFMLNTAPILISIKTALLRSR